MFGLTYIRNLYNFSMDDLSKKLSVSKQTISKWENKKIPISEERLEQLSEVFKIPKEYFSKDLFSFDEANIQIIKLENTMDEKTEATEELRKKIADLFSTSLMESIYKFTLNNTAKLLYSEDKLIYGIFEKVNTLLEEPNFDNKSVFTALIAASIKGNKIELTPEKIEHIISIYRNDCYEDLLRRLIEVDWKIEK